MDSKTDAERIAYKKQKNCVNLIQKEKKACFTNLKIREVKDYKTFWRKVKLFLSEKVHLQTKIKLVEKGKISREAEIPSEIERVVSKILNDFFLRIKFPVLKCHSQKTKKLR